VVDVGYPVGDPHDLTLPRYRVTLSGMVEDPVSDLVGEVQSLATFLEDVHHPQRVLVVAETTFVPLTRKHPGEGFFAGVSEGSVTEIVA
jgi:hypothetical protein